MQMMSSEKEDAMPPVASAVSRLPHLPPPVLTAYLDTNPANPQNQSTPRGYISRLKSAARALERDLPLQSRQQFRRELSKVMDYLRSRRGSSPGHSAVCRSGSMENNSIASSNSGRNQLGKAISATAGLGDRRAPAARRSSGRRCRREVLSFLAG